MINEKSPFVAITLLLVALVIAVTTLSLPNFVRKSDAPVVQKPEAPVSEPVGGATGVGPIDASSSSGASAVTPASSGHQVVGAAMTSPQSGALPSQSAANPLAKAPRQTAPDYTMHDAGLTRNFVLALDELWVTDLDGKGRVVSVDAASPQDLEQIVLAASASGEPARAVLYEDGAERNEFTRRVVSPLVTVQLSEGATPAEIAQSVGASSFELPEYAPGFAVLKMGPGLESLRTAKQLADQPGVMLAEAQLGRQQAKKAMPNDALVGQQWHLKFNNQTGAVAGTDLNIETAWAYPTNGAGVRGRGIRIGIVDDGLQTAHPDLSPNVDTTNDYDWNDSTPNDPNPSTGDDHGTACAGDAAARGNNNIGVSGSAPEATLVGMRLIAALTTDAQEAAAMNYLPQLIQIKSNSWGPTDTGSRLEGPGPLTVAALKNAVETGRGGKGTIITWAGGNGLGSSDNSNYDGYANSIYTIAVGAFDSQSRQAYYSESGANLVITSPSSGSSPALGKTTTDRTGSVGYASGDYTTDFGGTSSATPTASGVIALMLEANPNLGWRDVQEILMRSAKKVNPSDADWKTPIAPASINHNHKFGAGLIDATAAVNLAKTWVNLGIQKSAVSTQSGLSVSIPDNNATGVTRSFDFSASNLRVEHVTVKLSVNTVRKGQLEVTLTSPSGTVSRLAEKHGDTTNLYTGWTFMTVRNWGENSRGTWTLKVADRTANSVGTLTDAEVTIYGTDAVPTNPPPSVTVTQPASGSFVASGTNVTLSATASDFTADGSAGVVSSVQFYQGSSLIGTASLDSGSYTYTWNNPSPGTYSITARAADSEGATGTSSPVSFTILSGNGSPVVSSFSPASAPVGSSVVLTGGNFVDVSGVAFNGTPASSFTVNSATQITAFVPNGAATGLITVTNSFGSGASASAFTVTQLPVLISQIYGAGGNTGAAYNSDYIELYNRSASPVNLAGWSLQYASSAGTSWNSAALSGTIGAGKYFLVKLAGGASGAALPTPDSTPTTSINMSGAAGKVALMNSTTVLTGSSPIGVPGLQDFVGYGTANAYEGAGPAPAGSSTLAVFRGSGGAADTGDNSADFTSGAPSPRNSNTGSVIAPVITSASTASGTVGQAFSYQITASNTPTSFNATGLPAGLSVNTSTGLISGTPSAAETSTVTISASNSAGTDTKTLTITVSSGESGPSYTTGFEDGAKTSYASASVTLGGISWNMTEALIGTDANDFKVGTKSARLRGYSASAMTMLGDTTGGLGTISFQHRRYGSDSQIEWIVEYSTNGGASWTEAGRFTSSAAAATFTASVNNVANGRVRIRTNDTGTGTNRRTNIDEFSVTSYSVPTSPTVAANGALAAVSGTYGSVSGSTSFTVSGQNLTTGILITPPPGFEVSQTPGGASGYAATQTVGGAGTVASTTVYLRLAAGTSAGTYSGNVVCSSAGAASASVVVPDSDVLPRSLTISANNRTKPFGTTLSLGAGQTDFSAAGLVAGETVGSVTLAATGGTSANDAAGTYFIYPSDATGGTFSPSNYNITYSEGQLTVTGVSFSSWAQGLTDASAGADPDGNGLSNLAEYFMGMPQGGSVLQMPAAGVPTATTFHIEYSRSKALSGVSGGVAWRNDLTTGGWSTNGVIDEFVSDHGTYEKRRATVPVQAGETRKFLRLEVHQQN